MTPFDIIHGTSPIILGQPHGGTFVPDDIAGKLNTNGRLLADADWHIARLYEDLVPSLTVVRANFHRYVIDANRDPSGQSLYPSQNTTGLVPLTDFDNKPIWKIRPDRTDIERRLEGFHRPYHRALDVEIARIKALHGFAIVYDCHSIRSTIPFLFDGTLPDFNIGTNNGITCAARIEAAVTEVCRAAASYTSTVNGRFKGGWATRHYGKPALNIHAIQMEIAQSAYLETEKPPFSYSEAKAASLRPVLANILNRLAEFKP